MIAAVLLAAGGSSRMGSPKQLLPYRGRSLLRHAAESALASVCRPLVVVLGHEAARMREELAGLETTTVVNERWEAGIGSSIRAGVAALPDGVEAAVILLADQPFAGPDAIAALTERFAAGAYAVGSAYGDTVGVPALFARAFFPRLLSLADNEGAKRLLADAERVAFPGGEVDIDTPEDHARLA